MRKIDLTELQGAVELVSDGIAECEVYICRRTGKTYWNLDDGSIEPQELPKDIGDPGKYAVVPNKHELDLGVRLVFDFTEIRLPDRYDEVRSIFRRKGAYARFKALLADHDLLETWYDYSETLTLDALNKWCESEGLEVELRDSSLP